MRNTSLPSLGVHHKQNATFDCSDGVISHLTIASGIDYGEHSGIVEHAYRVVEIDTVFDKVTRRFRPIPFEFHRWYLYTLSGDKITRQSPETASMSRPCDAL